MLLREEMNMPLREEMNMSSSPARRKQTVANRGSSASQKSSSSRQNAVFAGSPEHGQLSQEATSRKKPQLAGIDMEDIALVPEAVVSTSKSRSPAKSVGAMSPWGNRPISALSVHSERSITPDLCEVRPSLTPSPRKALFPDAGGDPLADAVSVEIHGNVSFCDFGVQAGGYKEIEDELGAARREIDRLHSLLEAARQREKGQGGAAPRSLGVPKGSEGSLELPIRRREPENLRSASTSPAASAKSRELAKSPAAVEISSKVAEAAGRPGTAGLESARPETAGRPATAGLETARLASSFKRGLPPSPMAHESPRSPVPPQRDGSYLVTFGSQSPAAAEESVGPLLRVGSSFRPSRTYAQAAMRKGLAKTWTGASGATPVPKRAPRPLIAALGHGEASSPPSRAEAMLSLRVESSPRGVGVGGVSSPTAVHLPVLMRAQNHIHPSNAQFALF